MPPTPCGKCTSCPCGVNGSIAPTVQQVRAQPQQVRSPPQQVRSPPQQVRSPPTSASPPASPQTPQQARADLSYLQTTPPVQQQYLPQPQTPPQQQHQYEQPLFQSTLLPQESVQQEEVRYQQPPPPLPPPQTPPNATRGGSCQGHCLSHAREGSAPAHCTIQRYPPQAQSSLYQPDQSSLQGYGQPQPARQTYPMAQPPQPPQYAAVQQSQQYAERKQSQQYAGGQQPPQYAGGQQPSQYAPGQQSPQYAGGQQPSQFATGQQSPQYAGGQQPDEYAHEQPQQPPAQKKEVASCVAPITKVQRKKPSMSCSCVKNRTRNSNVSSGARKTRLGPGGIVEVEEEEPDLPIADTYTCTRTIRSSDPREVGGPLAQQEQLRCNCREKKKVACHCKAPVKPVAQEKPGQASPSTRPPPTHAFVGCGQPYAGPSTYDRSSHNKCGHCSAKKKCVIQ
ncbi:glutenin, high molecular weight subunit DX5 isoform X1 [Drosophila guanche]|uniref:Blast:Nuclear transcription factor Y subunit gamma n=1 Tax=Drosophila guanche TaxID=7266 RepID=A0A3B0KD40_DROGU|nr:glutenin, high molecular weight subunit DX5 isoform X1 [Drosophila guanche]XP_034131263.1 glutenin, high molecular weight subunit DX5 isoform X1 [Drosophila guanche]SPP83636.1 blast:Nuclear transcription factor Y subunit gamma [Drosophila guanche]